MEFTWRDPVDRVFGIVGIGALIVSIVLFFYYPDEILMIILGVRVNWLFFGFLVFSGVVVGWEVVNLFSIDGE